MRLASESRTTPASTSSRLCGLPPFAAKAGLPMSTQAATKSRACGGGAERHRPHAAALRMAEHHDPRDL